MRTIRDVEAALQLVLVESASEHGVRSGWQQRRSPLSAHQFVQTLVWGFLEAPEATLGQLAQVAHATGALVTAQALSQRFSARSVALLRGVLSDALGVLLAAEPVEVALLGAFPGGVYLDDTTQIALPAAWQPIWDGGGTAAALKIPALFDLLRGSLQLEVTAARHHDSVTHLANLAFPAGSVVIEDLGYLDRQRMQRRQAQGVGTIVPLRCTLALHDQQGRRINLLAWLRRQAPSGPPSGPPAVERMVCWQGMDLRVVAVPAAPDVAARKRAGIRAAAQQHGRPPHPTALALADWNVVLTSVPTTQATAQQIATLLRLRWQIELVFKLWKDQGKLDETRGWNAARIETELYAKLLGLLIEHWLALQTSWQWADRSLVKAGQCIRAYARSLCLLWTDHAALAHLCDLIARSLAVTGRIGSHCHQRSAAYYAQSA
jgi:hypothetical protein